jgi:tRNA(Ile)-lysidine synthase
LAALHVQHGLHPDADLWAEHCRVQTERLGVPLQILRVQVAGGAGISLEAAARSARYAALAESVGEDLLLLAQHADDQVETVLLQLLRGAGPQGLAAMAALERWQRGWRARPLLELPRAALHAYALAQGLSWVEDPSNLNLRFDRNYLRLAVMPVLRARWPSLGVTVGRAAQWNAECTALLASRAAEDLAQLEPSGASLVGTQLLAWPLARQKNLLRHWLTTLHLPLPDANRLTRICTELLPAAADRQPWLYWPGVEMRRYRTRLYAFTPLPPAPVQSLPWCDAKTLVLPDGCGSLTLRPTWGQGIAARLWVSAELRFRGGGESFWPQGSQRPQALKHWLQAQNLPPWTRARLPLLYLQGQLAAVADLAYSKPHAAQPDEAGLSLSWQRDLRL